MKELIKPTTEELQNEVEYYSERCSTRETCGSKNNSIETDQDIIF